MSVVGWPYVRLARDTPPGHVEGWGLAPQRAKLVGWCIQVRAVTRLDFGGAVWWYLGLGGGGIIGGCGGTGIGSVLVIAPRVLSSLLLVFALDILQEVCRSSLKMLKA